MTKYNPVNQKDYPKFFCNKCGSCCIVTKALDDYDSNTGEKNYKYWLKCPNYKWSIFGDFYPSRHQNEGAHLIDDSWYFSSGYY